MGAATSKAAKTTANAAKRQYPTRVPPTPKPAPASSPGPTVHPKAQASTERTEAIDSDAFDPQLAASLRSLGPVTPNPTLSNSSTFNPPATSKYSAPIFPSPADNPALQVLKSRKEVADRAEAEMADLGRKGFSGREFLDVVQIRQVLMMRDGRGMGPDEIEGRLGLRPGVVAKLGKKGLVGGVGLPEEGSVLG